MCARDYASYCAQVGGSCGDGDGDSAAPRPGPSVSVPSWPGRWWRRDAVAGLVALAACAVAAAGCSWGRRARARDFFFVFSARAEAEGNGIFADGGVEPGFGARGKAWWRTPRRWAATVGRAGIADVAGEYYVEIFVSQIFFSGKKQG